MKNRYIVIEGLEGAGKTTAIKTVVEKLNQIGITAIDISIDPGGTPLADKLRQLLKLSIKEEKITSKAELLMFYAARIQSLENFIKPALSKGQWVIGDRYELSSQAYQGGGRMINHQLIQILSTVILNGFKPDLTLYLDIEPTIGLKRASNRGKLDRIEKESLDFFNRTRQRYFELAAEDDTIITIDASQSLEKVQQNIKTIISNWLITYGE